MGLRPQTDRYLLLHRRRRLDHRAYLSDVRTARQRRDRRDLRRSTQLARRGAVLEDHRGLPGFDPLHRAHGNPRLHEMGRAVPQQVRPVEPPVARECGRADQSRSLDVVLQGDRRRALPDRRYLVANRDRLDHDRPDARRDSHDPRLGDSPVAGNRPRDRYQGRATRSRQRRRLPRNHTTLAVDAPDAAQRRRALPGHLLVRHPRRPTSPATAPAATPTATTGSWDGSTTF